MENMVAIVIRTSECDVEELPGMPRMSREDALNALRGIKSKRLLDKLDLVSVMPDGTLGRYVSWAL